MMHVLRLFLLCTLLLGGVTTAEAQKSRKKKSKAKTEQPKSTRQFNNLKAQESKLQKDLSRASQELGKTKKDVSRKEQGLTFIENQLEARVRHLKQLEEELARLDKQMATLEKQVERRSKELAEKKAKYTQSLRYAYSLKTETSPLVFIFSARSFPQMYRRARYAREYAAYQRVLGEQVLAKRGELLKKQNELLVTKDERTKLMHEVMRQRKQLNEEHFRQKKEVTSLKQKRKELERKVKDQRQQLSALDKKIDDLIEQEIERARKAEEARKAEARRKAEAERQRAAKSAKKTGTTTPAPAPKKSTTPAPKQATSGWNSPEEHRLNANFERNKGRLPVPITGNYMLGNRFGVYNVPGLKNVKLDNKGTNYIGKPGARARAIFDGVVSEVFQFSGVTNVLVRHGRYISVYCNLSSVIVKKGQRVKARDLLGAVANDGEGHYILHFQLRKEKQKLNPEAWLAR